eukprot:SAG22_NODE_821_length_7008_cov_8.279635_2_plen_422_part_00
MLANADAEVARYRKQLSSLVGSGSIRDCSAAIASSEPYRDELAQEREAVLAHVQAMSSTAALALEDMLSSSNIFDVDEALNDYADFASDDPAVSELIRHLREHRLTLLEKLQRRIQQACSSSDVSFLSAELHICEAYAAELPREVAQLRRQRDDILGTVRQRLLSLINETDPSVIEEALEATREIAEVTTECVALRSRLKLLVDDARIVLHNMSTGTNMRDLLAVHDKYKPFASYAQEEWQQLEAHMDRVSEEDQTDAGGSWRDGGEQAGGASWRSRGVQRRRQTQVEQGNQSFGQTVEESIKAAQLLEETNAQLKRTVQDETSRRVDAERKLANETKKRKRLEQELARLQLEVQGLESQPQDVAGGQHRFYPQAAAATPPDEACIICGKRFSAATYDKHSEECLLALIDYSVKNAVDGQS